MELQNGMKKRTRKTANEDLLFIPFCVYFLYFRPIAKGKPMRIKQTVITLLFISLISFLSAQIVPDIEGYKTLKCDLHMHTVFSDGDVWPTIRIDEAMDEGLDAIAISDHLEYQPHKKHVSSDRNISNEIARKYAKKKGMICIAGVEITRWMPPGHFNVLFIEDGNKLMIDDFLSVIEEAIAQGGYIFWNHPGWIAHQPDKVVRWYDIHQTLVDRGWLHGIEFANTHEYYTESMGLANEHGLAVLGNTDVHGMVYREFLQKNDHRPMTLVFAKEKSEEGIKEALFAKRTIALSEDNVMAGPESLVRDFIMASLELTEENNRILVKNISEIPYIFTNDNNEYTLDAMGELALPKSVDPTWILKNVWIDSSEHLTLTLR